MPDSEGIVKGIPDLEVKCEEFEPRVEVYTGDQLDDPILRARLAKEIFPSYAWTFGEYPWNEGAISASGTIISLTEYSRLGAEDQLQYRLFYSEEEFIRRVDEELSGSQDQVPYLSIVRDQGTGNVVGAAWGVQVTVDRAIGRIGAANYSQSSELEHTWSGVSDRLSGILKSKVGNDVFYWDEIFMFTPLQRHKVAASMIDTLLGELVKSNIEHGGPKPLPIMFRTSIKGNSAMGKFAKKLVGTGVFAEVQVEDDLQDIAYYVGALNKHLVRAASIMMRLGKGGLYSSLISVNKVVRRIAR